MSAFLEILVVAALAQLAVLPGEKVQLIIAALSTRFAPLLVVSAAGLAFALWTVLEILFGQALQQALPAGALEALTAGLFLLFAVLLVRSAPASTEESANTDESASTGDTDTEPTSVPASGAAETDGGLVGGPLEGFDPSVDILGHTVEGRVGSFLAIFAMMAAGEFGDKTQLVTISLAAQYGATPAIWAGEMLAIIPVSLANAYLFHRFAHRFDLRTAHFVGAALFAFFGLDTVLAAQTGFSVWETVVETISGAVLLL
jgi:putative Ca2+/H+ antiporter (TMEM165/GDT1 family)